MTAALREHGFRPSAALTWMAARHELHAASIGLLSVLTDVEQGTESFRNCERAGLAVSTVQTIWERET